MAEARYGPHVVDLADERDRACIGGRGHLLVGQGIALVVLERADVDELGLTGQRLGQGHEVGAPLLPDQPADHHHDRAVRTSAPGATCSMNRSSTMPLPT